MSLAELEPVDGHALRPIVAQVQTVLFVIDTRQHGARLGGGVVSTTRRDARDGAAIGARPGRSGADGQHHVERASAEQQVGRPGRERRRQDARCAAAMKNVVSSQ